MKSLTDLWRELSIELGSWCHTSTTLDSKKLESRVKNEGLSFLTITLPSFGKDFERCLEQTFVDDSAFRGFRRKGGLPLFLGGFLRQIFDPSNSSLLIDPCKDSIFAIRQLTLLFSKIQLPCSDDRVADAFWGYIRCEQDLKDWEDRNSFDKSNFERVSSLLFSDVFQKMDDLIRDGKVIPRHGPGATADRISGNQKFDLNHWSDRLESVFPFGEFGIPSWRYYYRYEQVEILKPGNEIPVRVIHVPKTLKTPRIIAMEPAYMQYMQQAILHPIVELLESKVVPGNTRDNLAFNFLGFTQQGPNRDLAAQGSEKGDLATLDLSEASDRVHSLHVETMLRRFPSFMDGVFATRSTKASIPAIGVDVFSLRKFASMGSALCFPFEAMVFLTAIFLGIEAQLGTTLTRKIVRSYVGKVRVYGDDLIVPVDCVDSVIQSLTRLGFKVNKDKSFWNGKFRESCGGDFFDGTDVTPVRFRREFPRDRRDVSKVESLVAFRNLMYERGLWKTTSWLDARIREILPYFPIVEPTSPCLGRRSFLPYEAERTDEATHSPRVRGYVARSRIPANQASGLGSLHKCLMPNRTLPFEDAKHLERSGRPSAADMKLKWIVPF
ncbi:TPA_asm: RNA-directed RNA polymerase [ssRNA phage Esthiorhiza.4_17]|uniref:RNA-directed RNA polymerase n=2 Tax=Leviviricetes TaxID=2842243 RepID=A0A8S5L3D7_9VIRU|nr:RNA-directed RNA polymerase [ssRNA phage Esthiorhiza.4_17]QDH90711.1 MAG: RNA-dependent RNA polymerase [Leviviridae sp.]DAD51837.1 TPA_asm: RNA-directed RNA polymerase [ssRNA phage Esthiorhiza.4_17]